MQSNNQSNSPFYQNKTNNQNPSLKDEKRISKFVKKVSFCANAIDDMVQNSSSFEDAYNYLYRFTKEQLIKFDNTLTNNLSKNDCIVIICKKYSFKAPKDFIFNIDEDIEENIENLTNTQLHDLYLTVYDSIGEAIENDDLVLHDKILPILRTIKTEIQNRNSISELELRKLDIIGKINALDNRFEFDEISASEYKEISIEYKKELESIDFDLKVTLINSLETQINRTVKKRTRNNLTLEYSLFLHSINKLTSKKFLSISYKRKEKTDVLRRVHTLLVYEHNRLNKVA